MGASARCVIFAAVAFFSMLGEGMAVFALTLAAADELGSWGVTALFLAGLVPPVVFAPWVGRWVDGSSLWRVWIINLGLHVLVFAAMALAGSIIASLALMSVASVCAVVNGAVIFKLIPRIRGGFSVARASSFLVVATSLAGIIAPAVASFVFAARGLGVVLWCAALGFVILAVAAVLFFSSQRSNPDETAASAAPTAPHAAAAARSTAVLLHDWRLRVLLLPMAAIVLFTAAEGVAGVFYLREVTATDTGYAVLLGAWSLGAVAGSLVGGNQRFGARSALPILLGGAGVGAAILVEGLWANPAGLAVVFLLGGVGNGLHNTGVRTAIYDYVPESRHGAAWAQLRMMINIMVALGYLVGTPGLFVEPAQLVIVFSGAGTLLAIALSFVLLKRRNGQSPISNR